LADSFGLKQMTPLMLADYFQSCPNGKSQQRDEGVPETNPIYVVVACFLDKLAGLVVFAKKLVKDV